MFLTSTNLLFVFTSVYIRGFLYIFYLEVVLSSKIILEWILLYCFILYYLFIFYVILGGRHSSNS